MSKPKLYQSAVMRVGRSPNNKARWCLWLACGHAVWITSKRVPSPKRAACSYCAAKAAARTTSAVEE